MTLYEILFIITTPIFTLSIFMLNTSFLGEIIISKKKEIYVYTTYSVLLLIIFFNIRFPIVFLIFNLVSFFTITLFYESSILNKIIYSNITYSILFIIEALVGAFVGYLDIKAFIESEFNSNIGLLMIRVLTLSVSYIIFRLNKNKSKDIDIPLYFYLIHIVVLIGTLYFFVLSLEHSINSSSGRNILSSFIFLIINCLVIFLDNKIYNLFILKLEFDIMKNQNTAYEKQNLIINESLTNIKSLKHDIKNHIIALSEIHKKRDDKAFQDYVNQIFAEIKNDNEFINSNNFVVDSIINFKLQKLLVYDDIEIDLNVNIPNKINIVPYDLTVILGNLIDNSINAIEKVDSNKKFYLSINYEKNNLIILIDNSYDGDLCVTNGELQIIQTENNGYGIKNINKILTKYNGNIHIETIDKMFSVSIVLPTNQSI